MDFLFVMHHEDFQALQLHRQVVGQVFGPFLVVVSPNHIDRRNLLQRVQNALVIDVPTVEDTVTAAQDFQDLLPEQAVGI